MNSFIDSVREYIVQHFDNLQDVEIIVPNNRTGSALLSSIKKNAKEVCWAPKITPIKDIFVSNTRLHEAENIVMIYLLYKIYCQYFTTTDSNMGFDNFYNFGEILLNDFDDIDKYLVNPHKLFKNIADEKEIDVEFADYDENLINVLRSFWSNVSENTLISNKAKSLELWQKMPAIYEDFTNDLREKGIGYQGLIYRDFIENKMGETSFGSSNYAFVGFSALNKCEKKLFEHIRNVTKAKNGKCLFFWDADKYYIGNNYQEAGLFLKDDLKKFSLPEDFKLSDYIKNLYKKDIQVIEVPTSVAQTKLIPELLSHYDKLDGKTAIILGDEKLLVPLIYSLPEKIKNDNGDETPLQYNITMGYPLSYTSSASFVQTIMKLAMHRKSNSSKSNIYFNRKDIFATIMHSFSRSYIDIQTTNDINAKLNECKIDYINIETIRNFIESNALLKILFDTEAMDRLFPAYVKTVCEFVYNEILNRDSYNTESDFMHKIITLFTSFINVLDENISFENDSMYYKLMVSMIKQSSMTFDGKSEDKMQILGFMETRCLDFDNVIMLSMNEGTFPKSNYKDSMIPYNLRKAFDMPSIEYQNSIFAYYFYRLLQRSQKVCMLYATEGQSSHAEKSRFITQIEYELREFNDIEKNKYHTTKSYKICPSHNQPIEIEKDDFVMGKIKDVLGCDKEETSKYGAFPTLINNYIKCPLSFYFNYIEELKKDKNIDDDTSALDFGNLLHISCNFLYKDFIDKTIQANDFIAIKGNIENAIDYAVREVFKIDENDSKLLDDAKSSIIIKPLRSYLKKIVDADTKYAPFKIIDLENTKIRDGNKDKNYTIKYKVDDKTILLKGIIDRIDLKGNTLRVIDYKTSKIGTSDKCYDENFWIPEKFQKTEAAQVLIYSEIMSQLKDYSEYTVLPYLISVTDINDGTLKFRVGKTIKGNNIENYQEQTIFMNDKETNLRENVNENLKKVLMEMLDNNTSIKQTQNDKNCENCQYNGICNRKIQKTNNK